MIKSIMKRNIFKVRIITTILILVLLIVIIWILITFPIQKAATLSALRVYLVENNIEEEEIYRIELLKDMKTAYGGYRIYVVYKTEPTLVYKYRYSFSTGEFQLIEICINENAMEEGQNGGDTISRSMSNYIPLLHIDEEKYYYDGEYKDLTELTMKYSFMDYIKGLFKQK